MNDVFTPFSLLPYPNYKNSGLQWLGEVLEHWDVHRIHNAVELRMIAEKGLFK